MKKLQGIAQNLDFFNVYALPTRGLNRAGLIAQFISAVTAWGGIYAATMAALAPIAPRLAPVAAMLVATLGVMVIELGLRGLLPLCVDAVLHRRWQGLHRVMSISVFALCLVLSAASVLLSFTNSKTIVAAAIEQPELATTAQADSTLAATSAMLTSSLALDITTAAQRHEQAAQAARTAHSARATVAALALRNIETREKVTGQSYISEKLKAREAIATVAAANAAELQALDAQHATAAQVVRDAHRAALEGAQRTHATETASIKAANTAALAETAAKVQGYGGGLAWFTVVCFLIFAFAVVLDRVHTHGAGIVEQVAVTQYDLNPHWLTEAATAIGERWQYWVMSKVAAFADATPPAPLPPSTSALYDPTAAQGFRVLDIEHEATDEQSYIITEKRRPIGFNVDRSDADAHARARNGERLNGHAHKQCAHCANLFEAKHWAAKYCGDPCRIAAWEERTGARMRKGKK